MNPKILRSFLAAAIAGTAVCIAAAQPATGKRVGTRDELRTCMNERDAIDEGQKALQAKGLKLGEEAKAVAAEAEEVNAEQKRADEEYTGPRLERFQRKARAHKARLAAAQEAEKAFDADRAAFDRKVADYREKCNNVSYLTDDVDAVKKEREAAGKK